MAYVLTKNKDKLSLYSNLDLEGYKFNPKKEKTIISVNKVVVVNPILVDNILSIKFQDKFKALLKYASYVINDEDASSTDTAIVLDEVAMLKGILLNRYQKFLSKDKEMLFLEKLRLIENQIRSKDIAIKMNAFRNPQESMSSGKSR